MASIKLWIFSKYRWALFHFARLEVIKGVTKVATLACHGKAGRIFHPVYAQPDSMFAVPFFTAVECEIRIYRVVEIGLIHLSFTST